MATTRIITGALGYAQYYILNQPFAVIDHNVPRNATTGTAGGSSGGPGAGYKFDYDGIAGLLSNLYVQQQVLYFDLSTIPPGSVITAGTINFTVSVAGFLTGSPTGTLKMALIGPGNGSSTINAADWKEMNGSPTSLCTDWDYDGYSSHALNATGVQHLINWHDSDQGAKFLTAPVPMIENEDYVGGSDKGFDADVISAVTLTITYDEPSAVLLGCNF